MDHGLGPVIVHQISSRQHVCIGKVRSNAGMLNSNGVYRCVEKTFVNNDTIPLVGNTLYTTIYKHESNKRTKVRNFTALVSN